MDHHRLALGQHGGRRIRGQRNNVTLKMRGNSRAYVVARLERNGHAALAAKVRAGELSAWAAAREAGWPRWRVRRREPDARERTEQDADARLRAVEALIA